jgi:hypothetical protein
MRMHLPDAAGEIDSLIHLQGPAVLHYASSTIDPIKQYMYCSTYERLLTFVRV